MINSIDSAQTANQTPGRRHLQPLTLRRNFSWTIAGQAVYAASNCGMLMAVAKLGTPEMVGQYAFGIAVTQPIFIFSMLNLRSVQASDVKHEYQFGHFFALRLVCTALAILVAVGIGWCGFGHILAAVIFLTGLGVAFDTISDIMYGLFTQRQRMDRIAVSQMLKGPLSLAGLVIGICAGGIIWGLVGSVIASVVVLCCYDLPSAAQILKNKGNVASADPLRLFPLWDWHLLGKLTRFALPLGFTLLLVTLNTHIPRYFVQKYVGESQLGIFAAMSLITSIGKTVNLSLSFATAPRLARAYADRNSRGFTALLGKFALVAVVIGLVPPLVAMVAGRQLLTLLYKPEYATQLGVFSIILIGGGLNYLVVCLGSAMTAAGMTTAYYIRIQLLWFGLATGVMILTNWWLTPVHGLWGSAVASVITAAFQLLTGLFILAQMLRSIKAKPIGELS